MSVLTLPEVSGVVGNPLTQRELAADPAAATNRGSWYAKDVGGVTEAHFIDSAGNVTQITSGGVLNTGEISFGAMQADRVVVTDGDGVVTTDADLTYNATTNVLTSKRQAITAGTIADGDNVLNLTATMPAVIGGTNKAVAWIITSAGSSAQTQIGLDVTLAAGYTGNDASGAFSATNTAAGTGAAESSTSAKGNFGFLGVSSGVTAGSNIGARGRALNSSTRNTGFVGIALDSTAGANIGVAGYAVNGGAGTRNGGWFSLRSGSFPTFVNAALGCDNAATTDPIFVARDNNTSVFTIADGGDVTIIGNIIATAQSIRVTTVKDVNNVTVLTTQQAAIATVGAGAVVQVAAGATDCEDTINLILVALRAHGIIAT